LTAGTIATPHTAASQAGADALRAGGNALDAALAAAAVLTVVYPHNCALGGDLFALVAEPDGRVHAVNASGPAALATDADAVREYADEMPTVGVAPITVPGLVAGWERLHRLGAARSWSDALTGAADLARNGAPVAPGLATAIAGSDGVGSDPGMMKVFAPGGSPLRAGDRLLQPQLARTLEQLAADGAGTLYRGPIGAALISGLRERGSALGAEDLARFAVQETEPLTARFGDVEVLTSPPNSSGVLLVQALLALREAGLADPLGADAAALAAIFAAGHDQRARSLCDPRTREFERQDWLGAERIGELSAIAVRAAAGEPVDVDLAAASGPRPRGDTIALVATDAEGRAVSLIQSLYYTFGSQILEPSTGILLHNRGAGFSLTRGHPNELAGGRRPAHTLMPVMVRRGGRLLGVLGTMGGAVHAQIHLQVLLRLLAGATAPQAVAAPRFAIAPRDPAGSGLTVAIEQDCDPAVAAAMRNAGLQAVDVPRHSSQLGHAQAIWLTDPATGGSDPRADGAAVSVA
jgi:gamma-glutamyltranspeptidase